MASPQFDLSAALEKIAEAHAVLVEFDRSEAGPRRAQAALALPLVDAALVWLETARRDLAVEAAGESDG